MRKHTSHLEPFRTIDPRRWFSLRRPYILALSLPALALSGLILISGAPQPEAHAEAAIEGRYIVVLEPGANSETVADELGVELGFDADTVYKQAIDGFAADMSVADAAALAQDPLVVSVEPDHVVTAALHDNLFQTLPTGIDRIDTDLNSTAAITGTPGADLNIDIAVIDSGIDTEHTDLNVAGGVRFTGSGCADGPYDDDFGHGTHVAGIIAAKDDDRGVVGVAPGARLWAVKVLTSSGSGLNSCVIAAVDWVAGRRAEFNDGPGDGDPGVNIAVANMSLGGPPSSALCNAIANAVIQGVMVPVAAGNNISDASTSGPANCSMAIAVSAYADFDGAPGGLTNDSVILSLCTEDEDDSFACFSNFGPGVEIAAPGVDVVSTWPGDEASPNGLYAWSSGTSMASPHVAGALALLKLATGYNGGAQPSSAMAALTAQRWAIPQQSSCGFSGDPDEYPEPVLVLDNNCTGCPDNIDCDGWTDNRESYLGTESTQACAGTVALGDETPDAWPPDMNDNRTVNTLDIVPYIPVLNLTSQDPGFSTRFDLNEDARINTFDIVSFIPLLNKTC